MYKSNNKGLLIIPPEEPAARDEGPRLIPLPDGEPNQEHMGKIQHYMNLADVALKLLPKKQTHRKA